MSTNPKKLSILLLALLILIPLYFLGKHYSQKNRSTTTSDAEAPQPVFLKDYQPSAFLIESTELKFFLDPQSTIVEAKLNIRQNPQAKNKETSIILDGIDLKLLALKLNGEPLSQDRYSLTPKTLTIFKVPGQFTLETKVEITPNKNLTLEGLYMTGGSFCTKNESQGFRRITYFLDRPDVMSKFKVTLIANKPKYPVLLSNGNLITQKKLANNLHSAVWEDPIPKSAYLFALVAGKYRWLEDYHYTKSGRKITLRIYAKSSQLKNCHHAMAALKEAMTWDEKTFGLEYELDLYQIVAVDDFTSGAMENKGLNIFNSKLLLASPDTTTDYFFNLVTSVVAHEYFHNWTGNRVTCRNWFQVGLKEGLTTLREQMFMEDTHGRVINRMDSIDYMRAKQFAEDAGPLAHPVCLESYISIRNFYTATVYKKAAEVFRMLGTIFDEKTFIEIVKKYLKNFDGQPATFKDFLQTASEVTKTNLKQYRLWFYQKGTPILKVRDRFANNTYYLTIEQIHPKAKKDFCIPVDLSLINQQGTNILSKNLIVTKKEQTFIFPNIAAKPIPSLLRNFSAPVKVEYPYTDEELLHLIAYDQDPLSRWDTSQKLMSDAVLQMYKNYIDKKPLVLHPSIIKLLKIILADKKLDPTLKSAMICIPSEDYLHELLPQVDVDALYQTREFIKQEIAKTFKRDLLKCYKENNITGPYKTDMTSMGKRTLKDGCLAYLMSLNTNEIFDLCLSQLKTANNFTDIQACLIMLSNSKYPEKNNILNDYYKKWQGQTTLVNTWLAINASIRSPGALERVKKLITHPAFNIHNPNKVYAVIGSFTNNYINFHMINGDGYKFLADQVLTIDKFNPGLAARLAVPLTQGYKLDAKRKQLMQKQLIRISKTPNISKGIQEIVNKAME